MMLLKSQPDTISSSQRLKSPRPYPIRDPAQQPCEGQRFWERCAKLRLSVLFCWVPHTVAGAAMGQLWAPFGDPRVNSTVDGRRLQQRLRVVFTSLMAITVAVQFSVIFTTIAMTVQLMGSDFDPMATDVIAFLSREFKYPYVATRSINIFVLHRRRTEQAGKYEDFQLEIMRNITLSGDDNGRFEFLAGILTFISGITVKSWSTFSALPALSRATTSYMCHYIHTYIHTYEKSVKMAFDSIMHFDGIAALVRRV
eukprot:jgi/Bigna1/70719/fgenesh1_pg.13_\